MARLRYSYILRILDLVDEKIQQLQEDRQKELNSIANLPAYNFAKKEEETEERDPIQKSRLDTIIQEYSEIKEVFSSELEQIDIEISIRNKQWNQNQHKENQ